MSEVYYRPLQRTHLPRFLRFRHPAEVDELLLAAVQAHRESQTDVDRGERVPDWADEEPLNPGLLPLILKSHQWRFLDTGDASGYYRDDASAALYGVALALLGKGYSDAVVMATLMASWVAVDVAERHSTGERAERWLWRYNVLKAREAVRETRESQQRALVQVNGYAQPLVDAPQETHTTDFGDVVLSKPWEQRLGGAAQGLPLELQRALGLAPCEDGAAEAAPRFESAQPQPLQAITTPQALQAEIASLPPGDIEASRGALAKMLGMDQLWQEMLLHQLRSVSGLGLSALRKELRAMDARAREVAQLERQAAGSTLEERYSYVVQQDRVWDHTAHQSITREAFRASLNVGPRDAYKEAFEDGGIQRFDSTTYWPGIIEREVMLSGRRCLNVWRRSPLLPAGGDAMPWVDLMLRVARFKREEVEHFLDYCAFMLQHQEQKVNHAIIIGGAPGIGKDTILQPLRLALGFENVTDVHSDLLLSDFTDFAINKKLVIVQEAQVGTRREARDIENKLKPMCAAPPMELVVHPKGKPAYAVPNVVQMMMTTNNDVPMYVSGEDRRYFMMWGEGRFDQEQRRDERWVRYWREMAEWVNSPQGAGAVLGYLLSRDVSRFSPGAPAPHTEWHNEAVEGAMGELARLIKERVERHEGGFARDVLTTEQVEMEFIGFGKEPPWGRSNAARAIGHAMSELGYEKARARLSDGRQLRVTVVRNAVRWAGAADSELRQEVERIL